MTPAAAKSDEKAASSEKDNSAGNGATTAAPAKSFVVEETLESKMTKLRNAVTVVDSAVEALELLEGSASDVDLNEIPAATVALRRYAGVVQRITTDVIKSNPDVFGKEEASKENGD